MKTRAAILNRLRKPLLISEIELPANLKAGQVLVRIKATGVCGSQLNEIDGRKGHDPYLPHLLGHEGGGIIEKAGRGVRSVKPGDHVVLHWRPGTGHEAEPALYRWRSKKLNAGRVTTFQDRAVVSENRVTRIPKDVPFEKAALYGCCVTTAFGVIENDAKLLKNETVLIFGMGGVGLLAASAARIRKASKIIAVDIHPHKLILARKFGATHIVNSKKEDVKRRVRHILGGLGADVVLENTGLRQVIELSYELTSPQGRAVLVGVPDIKDKARLDTLPLHFGKVLTGSFGGSCKPDRDIPRLLRLERSRKFSLTALLAHTYPLAQINRAIQDMRSGRVLRPILTL